MQNSVNLTIIFSRFQTFTSRNIRCNSSLSPLDVNMRKDSPIYCLLRLINYTQNHLSYFNCQKCLLSVT